MEKPKSAPEKNPKTAEAIFKISPVTGGMQRDIAHNVTATGIKTTGFDKKDNTSDLLVAFGGISGVAIAFASQQFISNFFGGLTVHLTQPFAIGELIKIPECNIEGYIEEIGWYMTSIRDLDNHPIYIPNSIFNQSVVVNSTRTTFKRIYLKIGLRYKDIQAMNQVIDRIRRLVNEDPAINPEEDIKIYFTGFAATSLEIEISCYVLKEFPFDESKQNLLIKLASVIAENGAEISFITNIVEVRDPSSDTRVK